MAEAYSMRHVLLCSACQRTYNLLERSPWSLHCHHTICGSCVHHQAKAIVCPQCDKSTPLQDVGSNYSLIAVLEVLCQKCMSRKEIQPCGHCSQLLCKDCLKSHDALNDVVLMETEFSVLPLQYYKKENDRARAINKKIYSSFKVFHETLENIKKELEKDVWKLCKQNKNAYSFWKRKLQAEVVQCRKSIEKHSLDLGVGSKHLREFAQLEALKKKLAAFSKSLKEKDANKTPNISGLKLVDYDFNPGSKADIKNFTNLLSLQIPAQLEQNIPSCHIPDTLHVSIKTEPKDPEVNQNVKDVECSNLTYFNHI